VAPHKKKAEDEYAHLVLIDESGFLLSPLVRRSLAPRGQTPIYRPKTKQRQKVSAIAALSLSPARQHLGLYFRTYANAYVDSAKAADFLEELLRHLRGRVIVLWDGGQMHKGPAIRRVLERHPRLTLERLPPYAPDLNPVEHLWNYLKYVQLANFVPSSLYVLHAHVEAEFELVQEDQARLRTFWQASELPFPEKVTLVS
jgi:putative transposase